MVGITGFGTYVPSYRLSSEMVAAAWGSAAQAGERAVANHDEDSVTMALEALLHAMAGRPGKVGAKDVDGLFFASTTAPYREKQNAAIIATVADLRHDVFSADFGGSLRAGTNAVRAAADAVRAGSARHVAVAAADWRLTEAGTDGELTFGDAGAALIIGQDNVIASIEAMHSLAEDFTDAWRRDEDTYVRTADTRFIQLHGYERITREVLSGLIEKAGIERAAITRVIPFAPDARAFRGLGKPIGFAPEVLPDGRLYTTVGNTGTSFPLLSLVAALDEAKPGDRIAVVGYGNGADAILLHVTDAILGARNRGHLEAQIASKRLLSNYGKYLRFRQLVATEQIKPFTSEVVLWRERKADLQRYGQRCLACGAIQFPRRRVCWQCRTKDNFEDYKLTTQGQIYTYAHDHLVPCPDPPVIMAVVDLAGGGRFYGQITDCDPKVVTVGMPVQFTFRRFHEGGEFHNYFWKLRPIRMQQ